MSPGRRLLLTVGLPFLAVGGFFLPGWFPGFLREFSNDVAGPFLITYWMGLMFSNMYFSLVSDLEHQKVSRGKIAAVAGGIALIFFIGGGGPMLLWRDPWLFGITVMPGFEIAWPYLRDRFTAGRQPAPATGAEPPPPPALR